MVLFWRLFKVLNVYVYVFLKFWRYFWVWEKFMLLKYLLFMFLKKVNLFIVLRLFDVKLRVLIDVGNLVVIIIFVGLKDW